MPPRKAPSPSPRAHRRRAPTSKSMAPFRNLTMRRAAIAISLVGLGLATSCSLIHTLEPIDDGGCTGAQCDGGGQNDGDACTASCDMSKACTTAQTCSEAAPVCSSAGSCTVCTPGGDGTSPECATY